MKVPSSMLLGTSIIVLIVQIVSVLGIYGVTKSTWRPIVIVTETITAGEYMEVLTPSEILCSSLVHSIRSSTVYCYAGGTCLIAVGSRQYDWTKHGGHKTCRTSDGPAADGLYYIHENEDQVEYKTALERCQALPEGTWRLAQAKSVATMDVIRSFNKFGDVSRNAPWIALEYHMGQYTWADGTDVNTTLFKDREPARLNNKDRFVVFEGILDDKEISRTFGYLCQNNFENLDW